MRRRHFTQLLSASLIALAALPAPAAAQRIDRIVAFGDSYADDGNFFQITGVSPLSTQVYTTGRFTGGVNYIDVLSDLLNAPVENFAIGGALTNNTNTNGAGIPGFTFERTSFLAGGGGVFPTVDPTFDEGDLLTVSIGGNDARNYQRLGGTVAGAAAAATASVASAQTNLDPLVAAGAPTISYLSADSSRLPEVGFYPDPALAKAVRSAYAATFTPGIQDVLAGYADDGVVVHYLDLNLVLDQIEADPGAFGLTGVACPAFPVPAGPGVPGNTICAIDNATAAQYLIYGDQLHPTSAGSAIIAQYVATQLAAPLTLQAPVSLGVDLSRQFGRTLTSRVDLARGREPGEGIRLFAVGDFFSNDIDETLTNYSYENDGVGLTIGAESHFGGTMMGGVALNYSRSKSDFSIDASRNRSNSWQLGAYGGFMSGGLFAQGHAGFGKDEHRIRREGVIDKLRARPDGTHFTVGAKAGYLMAFDGLISGLRAGPVIAIDHARAKVDEYSEDGDAALSLSVSEQELKSTTGQLGLEGRFSLIEGVRSHATLTAEHEFGKDGRTILFAQNSAPTIVNQWNVEREGGTYGRLSTGASFDLWQGATLNTAISSTFGRKDGREFGLQLGFNTGF